MLKKNNKVTDVEKSLNKQWDTAKNIFAPTSKGTDLCVK